MTIIDVRPGDTIIVGCIIVTITSVVREGRYVYLRFEGFANALRLPATMSCLKVDK